MVALSGPVEPGTLEDGLRVLRTWGHPVVEASNLRRADAYLAGTDEQRLAGLEEVLDSGARFVIAARGGFGVTRLLPMLPLARMVDLGVTLVGFSDLTALLNPLAALGGALQFHGPMVAAGLARPDSAHRLRELVCAGPRRRPLFRFAGEAAVRHGTAVGRAVGGNLSVLTALVGTPWEPEYDGSVLFLEEVNEPLYRLDRMLTHLRGSARLRGVKALIGGSLRGCRPAGSRDERWRRLLLEAAPEGAPVVVGLPFGHGAKNLAFPIGAEVGVDTRSGVVTWS